MTLNNNESTRPNRMTFLHLLKLCAYSQSPDAGDIAQELLSRIQVLDLISTQQQQQQSSQNNNHNIIIHPSTYIKVMDCWKTSAWSSRQGAASSAQSFLNRIQAQCSKNTTMIRNGKNDINNDYTTRSAYYSPMQQRLQKESNENINYNDDHDNNDRNEDKTTSLFYNDNLFPNRQVFHHILIRTCSFTRLREDKPKALQIAFDTYHEMIDSSIIPPGW
eukprot:CAMPEP_0197837508 /NCGR_PEP_ID=MMETSP1437-20131217/32363_1 /TAXON_ID=49252 ORGANISM="Eucampia antarctica, Strain CCMP1452" /NCGR_SAMPLE_ID=MMETSP1437 /ASSEMBLY_ACC=CAM_ASM_001096 /LENGTH=218 /DNA_ID=CAMNT_0043444599 /DNA_START=117 /DNA_END=770 /DNA_ORIENTATION=-